MELHESDLICFCDTTIREHGCEPRDFKIMTSYDCEKVGFWVVLCNIKGRVLHKSFMPYESWGMDDMRENEGKLFRLGTFADCVCGAYFVQKEENDRKRRIIFGGG